MVKTKGIKIIFTFLQRELRLKVHYVQLKKLKHKFIYIKRTVDQYDHIYSFYWLRCQFHYNQILNFYKFLKLNTLDTYHET